LLVGHCSASGGQLLSEEKLPMIENSNPKVICAFEQQCAIAHADNLLTSKNVISPADDTFFIISNR